MGRDGSVGISGCGVCVGWGVKMRIQEAIPVIRAVKGCVQVARHVVLEPCCDPPSTLIKDVEI